MTPLTTKAAEIRAGVVAELRLAERIFKEDAEDRAAYSTGCVFERAAALIEQQAAELAEARAENERLTKESADRLKCMDRRADRLIELTDKLAEAKVAYGGMLSTWAESRERHLAAEARATTAASERDELLREKERMGAALAPFAKASEDCGVEDDIRIGAVKPADIIWESAAAASITFGHLEGARSALENGPAGLADAHSKSPDPTPSQSERIAVLEAALRDCVDTLSLVERPAFIDPHHGAEIEALGMRIGFGALMVSASASWRGTLERCGYTTGGEFVAGPCFATIVATLRRARAALLQEPAALAPIGEE